jgi:N-acetyl sugar amidotransferase
MSIARAVDQQNPLMARDVRICTKTVMDATDPDITFDDQGVCNYWHEWQTFSSTLPSERERASMLEIAVARIKAAGHGKAYDCVLGLSGGVDSSYLAYLAKELGLRPLVVHFDNGWNSELAVGNIEKIVSVLGYDLETFVMDWDEFRDLQRAYFKASVVDLEVPTDHMILGALYRIAAKRGIQFILSGTNYATEWLLPKAWHYRKFDLANLRAIHAAYGKLPLRRLPALGLWQQSYYTHVRRIESVPLLDLAPYNKAEAKALLMSKLGWRNYGGKHYESVFTRFYQGYVLPKKFGYDKRRAHLSSLILSGQMTREEALRELQQPTYDEDLQQQDKAYVAKKLGFTPDEFEVVLTQPNRQHQEFGTDLKVRVRYFAIVRALRRLAGRGVR